MWCLVAGWGHGVALLLFYAILCRPYVGHSFGGNKGECVTETAGKTETLQHLFSVRELTLHYSGQNVILAWMCNRNNLIHTCLGSALQITPSRIVLYQTFHIFIHKNPNKFSFIGPKLHNS